MAGCHASGTVTRQEVSSKSVGKAGKAGKAGNDRRGGQCIALKGERGGTPDKALRWPNPPHLQRRLENEGIKVGHTIIEYWHVHRGTQSLGLTNHF